MLNSTQIEAIIMFAFGLTICITGALTPVLQYIITGGVIAAIGVGFFVYELIKKNKENKENKGDK